MDISNLKPDFSLENRLWDGGYRTVGIDEAGRGTWAGPLFVGAVWLKPQHVVMLADIKDEINDSKKLSSAKRIRIYRHLLDWGVEYAVGEALPQEIDESGIEAGFKAATARALRGLVGQGLLNVPITTEAPLAALIDGARYGNMETVPGVEVFAEDRLDGACVSVALASICAKVHQEAQMRGLDFLYSEYGFKNHNGYPTSDHRDAVKKHGLSPVHRQSWAGREQ